MESYNADEFVAGFEVLLDRRQWDESLSFILEPVNENLIILSCIDIVTCLGRRLSDSKLFREDPEGWCTLQNILDYVVKIANPKETLIGLLELLDGIQTDEFFNSVLKPLKITFLRLRAKQPDSLVWAFNRLYSYIAKVDLSYDEEIQNRYAENSDEKLLFENWPSETRLRIDGLVESLLNFAEPFVSEVKQCKLIESAEQRNAQAMALVSILMKLLEYPVSHFDVGRAARKLKSDRIALVERLIAMLFDVTPNVYWKLFDWVRRGESSSSLIGPFLEADACPITPVSLGVLSTFVHVYRIGLDRLPCVYSPIFVVDSTLPFAVALLLDESASSAETNRKLALKLCKFFVKSLSPTTIPTYKLESPFSYRSLFFGLVKTVSFSHSPALRQKSFARFVDFFGRLDGQGQILTIRWIFRFVVPEKEEDDDDEFRDGDGVGISDKAPTNPDELVVPLYACTGIRGHAIDFFRNGLRKELEARKSIDTKFNCSTSDQSSNCFKTCLFEMFALFAKLKDGPETNLLHHFEQIMAVLNLLRYLCIVDGNFSILSKDWLRGVDDGLLTTLSTALDRTKSHYDADIRKSQSEGSKVKYASYDETAALKKELCVLDLMQYLLARVCELVRSSIAEK